MEEELDLYRELEALVPFEGSSQDDTPKMYLAHYFALGMPRTVFRGGRHQCSKGCNRSFFDLYYLTRAKFSNVTLEDVATILIDLCEDYDNTDVSVLFCDYIDKVVFTHFGNQEYDADMSLLYDHYTVMNGAYVSIYGVDNISLLDIISLAGKKRNEVKTIEKD